MSRLAVAPLVLIAFPALAATDGGLIAAGRAALDRGAIDLPGRRALQLRRSGGAR